jgi:microcystin-dependent protein
MKYLKYILPLFAWSHIQSAQPYVGEIRTLGNNFCPSGWFEANGQLLSISEYETLFNLIGTTFGGDGESNFALPNLSSRIAVGSGDNKTIGEASGSESTTLTYTQMPAHNHSAIELSMTVNLPVADSNSSKVGTQKYLGPSTQDSYVDSSFSANSTLKGGTLTSKLIVNTQVVGGSQPIDLTPPRLGMIHCISAFGIFPSQY